MKKTLAYAFAMTGGAALWIGGCRVAGTAEAWDHGIYLGAVLPALAVLTAALGFWTRGTLGLGIAASLGQLAGLFATTGGGGNLLPVGVGFLVLLSLPLGFTAWLGGALRGFCARARRSPGSVARGGR